MTSSTAWLILATLWCGSLPAGEPEAVRRYIEAEDCEDGERVKVTLRWAGGARETGYPLLRPGE